MEAPYNPETTYAHHIGPITLRFGDNLSLVCKHGHRLVAGNLIRVCQENGSWSGEKPICKRNDYYYLQTLNQMIIQRALALSKNENEICIS